MTDVLPEWLDPTQWIQLAGNADANDVRKAFASDTPGERELAALLSPAAGRQSREWRPEELARADSATTGGPARRENAGQCEADCPFAPTIG